MRSESVPSPRPVADHTRPSADSSRFDAGHHASAATSSVGTARAGPVPVTSHASTASRRVTVGPSAEAGRGPAATKGGPGGPPDCSQTTPATRTSTPKTSDAMIHWMPSGARSTILRARFEARSGRYPRGPKSGALGSSVTTR